MGGGGRERAGLKPARNGVLGRYATKRDAPKLLWERQAQRYYLLGWYASNYTLGPPKCQRVILEYLLPFRWFPQPISRIAPHSVWELTSAHLTLFNLAMI